MRLRHTVQELRELGPRATLFRVRHELRMRTGAVARFEAPLPARPAARAGAWLDAMPFGDPSEVSDALRAHVDVRSLSRDADEALAGRMAAFGGTVRDWGSPTDWYRDPDSGARWNASAHWSRSLAGAASVGDPKLTWERARFPHAYVIARAAAFDRASAAARCEALTAEIDRFLEETPHPFGLHWFSSQELEIRLAAWAFAARCFQRLGCDVTGLVRAVEHHAWQAGHHTERELDYARHAVNNNHLIAEALGLVLCAALAPACTDAERWRRTGLAILDEEAARQVYPDGAYLNLAHNYHRTVLHDYLLAARLEAHAGRAIPAPWRAALERSLDFLVAHQEPTTGALPNYGSNDGSRPRVLSTCAFRDFRPTLQAVSALVRGERLEDRGPWDEETAWLLGARALDLPLRAPTRRSVSFAHTGFHVLRGDDARSFAAFRCGTVRDRFGQIDMLHLDVWWRGHNVLVDGGTYLYNGPRAWLDHFLRTASHNTVTVDGRDQMLHWRQFKFLYWTRARLLAFEARRGLRRVAGEHDGYTRHPGRCVHRRDVLMVGDALWIVADTVTGEGDHTARLHWLAGEFDHAHDGRTLTLATPDGPFSLAVFDGHGTPCDTDVARGVEDPPRGWLSRTYAQRAPVASLAAEHRGALPHTWLTVMGAGTVTARREGARWRVVGGGHSVSFALADGLFSSVEESVS